MVLIAFFQRWRDRYQTGIYEAVDQTILRKRVGVATFLYYYFGDFSLYFDSIIKESQSQKLAIFCGKSNFNSGDWVDS